MSIKAKFTANTTLPATLLCQAKYLLDRAEEICDAKLSSKRRSLASSIRKLKYRCRQQAALKAQQQIELLILAEHSKLQSNFQAHFKTARNQFLQLVLDLSKKVIAENIPHCHIGLESKIEEIANRFQQAYEFKVSVNSCHLQAVSTKFKNIKILPDDTLLPGNAKISSIAGHIIIDWQKQFDSFASFLALTLDSAAGIKC